MMPEAIAGAHHFATRPSNVVAEADATLGD
jgi:hypothetical protein